MKLLEKIMLGIIITSFLFTSACLSSSRKGSISTAVTNDDNKNTDDKNKDDENDNDNEEEENLNTNNNDATVLLLTE